MKILIIVFSPGGNTLKVAHMIETAFQKKNQEVQLIDITANNEYLYNPNLREKLRLDLKGVDVIFIGAPVYAGHAEQNILTLIKALPKPENGIKNLAVPFVTYGGVHSSIALEEMGKQLKKRKYKSLLGIKMVARHNLTRTFSVIINKNKPGCVENCLVDQAIEKICDLLHDEKRNICDQSTSFKYSSLKRRVVFHLLSQESFHKKYKNVSINSEKCIGCNMCISICPVNLFKSEGEKIVFARDKNNCILCAECFHACPAGAVEHPYIEKARLRLKDGKIKLEEEASAIYTL
nr:EFR1 family ferrodoxin [uncultured Draconibacterium sp.]